MAVYTRVNLDDVATFLKLYDLAPVTRIEEIAEGVENSNYRVITEEGRYILTLFEKRVNPDDLPYFLGLMNHLADGGVRVPHVLENAEGQTLGTLQGKPACVIEHLRGHTIQNPTAARTALAGDIMARMHVAAEGFKGFRANDLSIAGWRTLKNQCLEAGDHVINGVTALITQELAFLEAHWPNDLPSGPIHADLFPDNLMIDESGGLTGVIDFYFGCNDAFAYDLAIALNAWCFNKQGDRFEPLFAKNLLAHYDMIRPLSQAELSALPVLARGAALRFLLTRLVDWINHDASATVTPKNPQDYVNRLKFHQSIRDVADYAV